MRRYREAILANENSEYLVEEVKRLIITRGQRIFSPDPSRSVHFSNEEILKVTPVSILRHICNESSIIAPLEIPEWVSRFKGTSLQFKVDWGVPVNAWFVYARHKYDSHTKDWEEGNVLTPEESLYLEGLCASLNIDIDNLEPGEGRREVKDILVTLFEDVYYSLTFEEDHDPNRGYEE